ncbi:MAG: 4-hydroxy-tetrahydrodipicolinate reductase [Syntrophorhabdaceae bacterium]|nr:4-hydroxy-tetrahydrodipicolinate reductase [Syntrophorhabdaceae bacterium]
MVRLIITGAAGKMGKAIIGVAGQDRGFEITGLTERKGHPLVGKQDPLTHLVIRDDLEEIIDNCDVVIDFTEPKSSIAHLKLARAHKKAIVIGTTGFTDDDLAQIKDAGDTRVVFSPNMSMGMNLMFDLVERATRILKDNFDIEILEMHHKWKKDAPSGTALKIKDIIEQTDKDKTWEEIYGRQGVIGERKKDELAVLALRGGDIVGEHTVFFAGIGERVEITHRAYSRENFARGALIAARWLVNQENGIYSMKDVLGL